MGDRPERRRATVVFEVIRTLLAGVRFVLWLTRFFGDPPANGPQL
ncbi:hypothetical protein [Nocardiopsis sp. NRRL B-16309]|nr:hypothetical protein [Nocardiopsis sp. NRRL B-16309]